MRKRIAVFGGSLFQDIKLESGKYITTSKQALIKLSNKYDIDNFSLTGLTIERAYRLLKGLDIKKVYNDCILALGEADLNDVTSFENNLSKTIEYLLNNDVRPLLVSLPAEILTDSRAMAIQEIIDHVAIKYNIDYIYDGRTDKIVSYIVLDNDDMSNAILELC